MSESEINKSEINFFAKTNFRNREVPFGIKLDDRRRHMYIIGKTGMGKTTLMENMAIQDIQNGHGVCFMDPHGDSVAKILNFIPSHRVNDVVYFNPADLEYPIGFNVLEAVNAEQNHLVASGLMGVFTKIWANMWSSRMEYILNHTILALLDSPGNTMLGILRMYVDKKYRKKIVDNTKDPVVKSFWLDEFANYAEKFRTEAVAPIQNKVGQFLSAGIVRNIVGQPKSTLDLRKIMDEQKILLVDLSKGKVGEDNSALLGAMLITKLQLAALSRVDIPEKDRKDYFLYVDEFQNFVTDSFATILSEARKYRLNLTVGHQYIGQLTPDKNNTKVRDAVFGNVGTMVVFRVGAADAEYLETEFDPIYTPTDIVNLPKYNVILKLMINGIASEPFSATTLQADEAFFSNSSEKVIKVSRERYGNPIAEVEEKISRWLGSDFQDGDGRDTDEELSPRMSAPYTPRIDTPRREYADSPSSRPARTYPPRSSELAGPRSAPSYTPRSAQSSFVRQSQPLRQEQQKISEPEIITKKNITFAIPAMPVIAPETPLARTSIASASFKPTSYNRDANRRLLNNISRVPVDRKSRPKSSLASKPAKHENPIWNTVADIHREKMQKYSNEVSEVIGGAVSKPFEPASRPEIKSAPVETPSTNTDTAQVLEPGEVQKF